MASKNKSIMLRLDEETILKLDDIASNLGMTRSELIRDFISNGIHNNKDNKIQRISDVSERQLHSLLTAINRVGNNINQIARNKDISADMKQDIATMKKVLELTEKALIIKFE